MVAAGWFSFDEMGSTAGDVIARDVVRGWLRGSGIEQYFEINARIEGETEQRLLRDISF